MFILNEAAFGDRTAENIREFVDYWSKFYTYSVSDNDTQEPISYLHELCLGGVLDRANIRKLLRWKSPRFFTDVSAQGVRNQIVEQILERTDLFNALRKDPNQTLKFDAFVREVFRTGRAVYRAFLFHVARPVEYPIWDQHVARVHALMRQRLNAEDAVTDDWNQYEAYRNWFSELKGKLGINSELTSENVRGAKKLDSALMAYGQFLKTYA